MRAMMLVAVLGLASLSLTSGCGAVLDETGRGGSGGIAGRGGSGGAGGSGGIGGSGGAAGGAGGAGEPTFESVDAVFKARCAFAGCHLAEFPARGLSLDVGDAYESLLGPDGAGGVPSSMPACAGLPMVQPGAPDESCLWVLVGSGVMPPGGMAASMREAIRAWIEAGAPPPAE